MNGLEIAVLSVIAVCGLIGYFTGFLRAVYSLFAWIFLLAFVAWATPRATVFIEENTGIGQVVQDKCADYIRELADEKIRLEVEHNQNESQSDLEGMYGLLPKEIVEEFADYAAGTAGEALEEAGVYKEIAGIVSHYILEGIVFLFMMTVGGILTHWIAHALDLASRFPALKGPNKILGAAFGMAKGLFLVWICFLILTLLGGGESGNLLLASIEESRFLQFLYQNNILLWLLMGVLR